MFWDTVRGSKGCLEKLGVEGGKESRSRSHSRFRSHHSQGFQSVMQGDEEDRSQRDV
jgi:hypothetical protein